MATNQPMMPSVLSELDRQEMLAVERFGGKDTHISAHESPWVPWVGDIEIKILRVENRTGLLVVALRSRTDQSLGKHRHRGAVTATTIAGAWNYYEYDWVARPGDYVVETPGTIHTLHVTAGTEIVFTVTGSIEFLVVFQICTFLLGMQCGCPLRKESTIVGISMLCPHSYSAQLIQGSKTHKCISETRPSHLQPWNPT